MVNLALPMWLLDTPIMHVVSWFGQSRLLEKKILDQRNWNLLVFIKTANNRMSLSFGNHCDEIFIIKHKTKTIFYVSVI